MQSELTISYSVPMHLSIFDDIQLFTSCIGLMMLTHCRIHVVESLEVSPKHLLWVQGFPFIDR